MGILKFLLSLFVFFITFGLLIQILRSLLTEQPETLYNSTFLKKSSNHLLSKKTAGTGVL